VPVTAVTGLSPFTEKNLLRGRPDGGDGGRGGNIVVVADDNMSTLMDFRYKRKYVAPNGENGGGKRCSGKDGESVVIKVPRGTLVRDKATGGIIKDMTDAKPFVLAKGGRGGWGNKHLLHRHARYRALPSPE
jgi:GTP-binding protein